jgi:ABC-2 type transport system ATP-binding protein
MVDLQGITFGYGKRERLFDRLNLTLEPGNVYGLLGRNGAGKTTLLRLAAGLLFPREGSARVAGKDVGRRTPSFLRELYFVPEEFHTPALSPVELARLYGVFYPRFDHAAMMRYLADLEVDAQRTMAAMSYGQKKKVLLAFAVATGCRLLMLDEPTNGLDIPAKGQFRRLLAGAAADDRVIVVSTHQVRDLEHLIDPIVILEQGQIVFQHSVEEISGTLAVRDAAAAGPPDDDAALFVEPGTGIGGAATGRALVTAGSTPLAETAVDLELLFNSVIADHRRVAAAFTPGARNGAANQ